MPSLLGEILQEVLALRTYAKPEPPKRSSRPDLSEISANDSPVFRRWIPLAYNPDDDLSRSKGLWTYDKMRVDDQIKAAMALKKGAVLSTGWELQAASEAKPDQEARDFAEYALTHLDPLYGSLDDILFELLSALDYGYVVCEILWKVLEEGPWKGKIGLKTLKVRRPHTFRFDQDEYDNLLEDGLIQGTSRYPLSKFLIYSYQRQYGNFYGLSDLRPAYRCYSEDTQVLTEDGWKWFPDLRLTDRLATLNPETGCLEYQTATRLYSYPYHGRLFHQSGRFIDLLVTPNHRMWVAKGHRKPYRFQSIEAETMPRIVRYKRDASWSGKEELFFTLPAFTSKQRVSGRPGEPPRFRPIFFPPRKIPMDDWLRFFGIWVAEGSLDGRESPSFHAVYIFQKKGPKAELIRQWIQRCGFHVRSQERQGNGLRFEIVNRQLYEYLKQFGKAHEKFIPKELKGLSSRQLRILYEAMALGDGSTNGGYKYFTTSDHLADDVQELLLKTEYGSVRWLKNPGPGNFPGSGPCWVISRNSRNIGATVCNEHKDQRSYVDYVGEVFCVEVPNHLIYVQRNGKSCWSGNSWLLKDNILRWEGVFLERWAIPITTGTYPATHDKPGDITELRTILENLQANTTLTYPDLFKIDFREVQGRGGEVFRMAVEQMDQHIARSLLVPSLLGLSPQGDVGSYSQARKHFNVFLLVLEDLRRDLAGDVVQNQLLTRLLSYNFDLETLPTFGFLPYSSEEEALLFDLWLKAVAGGAVKTTFEDERHIRQVTGFPEREEEEEEIMPAPTDGGPVPLEEEGEKGPIPSAEEGFSFNPTQRRDEKGQWTSGGGPGSEVLSATEERHLRSMPIASLRARIQSRTHTVEDVIQGKVKVGVEGEGGQEWKKARERGLYTTEVKNIPIYAVSSDAARPLVRYLEQGGRYGTSRFSSLLGYTPQEIAEYEIFLERTGRIDLIGYAFDPSQPRDKEGKWTGGPSELSGGLSVQLVKGRAFTGEPILLKTTLSKHETGKLGEVLALGVLRSRGAKNASLLNTKGNNFPVDAVHDHEVWEVKAGLVSNREDAQKWRLTLGEPGQKERAWLAKASPEAKAAWNGRKQQMITERKQRAVKEVSQRLGRKVTLKTMTFIINPDTRRADVYEFDGAHDVIRWRSEQAQKAYKGTVTWTGKYAFDPSQPRDERGRWSPTGSGKKDRLEPLGPSGRKVADLPLRARQELVDRIASTMRVQDPMITVHESNGSPFTVGGHQFTEAAHYNPKTDEINIFQGTFDADESSVAGIVIHELSHKMMANFREKASFEMRNAIDNNDLRMDDSVKPMASGKYPAYEVMQKTFMDPSSRTELEKQDGITPYSKAYWEGWKSGERFHDGWWTPVNETVAESARLIEQGFDYQVPQVWKDAYRTVERHGRQKGK